VCAELVKCARGENSGLRDELALLNICGETNLAILLSDQERVNDCRSRSVGGRKKQSLVALGFRWCETVQVVFETIMLKSQGSVGKHVNLPLKIGEAAGFKQTVPLLSSQLGASPATGNDKGFV